MIVDNYAQFFITATRLATLDFGLLVEPTGRHHEMQWACYESEDDLGQAIAQRPSFMHHIKEPRFARVRLRSQQLHAFALA